MNLLSEFVSGILRSVVKAVLIVFSAVLVLSVLCVGLVVVLATVMRFLLTGRKPAVFTTFTRFNQAAPQFRPGSWSGAAPGARQDSGDVVDVQAHEVHPVHPALTAPPPPKAAQ